MTSETGGIKAKRGLFNRPKWAASKGKTEATAEKQNNDFFSRTNDTIAKVAAEEEEREKRRRARRAVRAVPTLTQKGRDDDSKPSPKRPRLSMEDDDSDDDGGDHMSDIEAEKAEEAAREAARAASAEQQMFTQLLDKGRAFVKDGMEFIGSLEEKGPVQAPSPSKLPSDAPRVPNDEQCELIRSKAPKLANCDNYKIRELAMKKWQSMYGQEPQSPSHVVELSKPLQDVSPQPRGENHSEPRSPKPQLTSPLPQDERSQLPQTPRHSTKLKSQLPVAHALPDRTFSPGTSKESAITLDDDEDQSRDSPLKASTIPDKPQAALPSPAKSSPLPAHTATENDGNDQPEDELDRIERLARERARRKRSREAAEEAGNNLPPVEADPTIQLLISTEIPNTQPLLVTRRISQRFRNVREYWCHYNNLSKEMEEKVVLTWRSRRLYDSQTVQSLGFSAGPDGTAVYKNDANPFEDYNGKIHLVAAIEGVCPTKSTTGGESHVAAKEHAEDEIRVTIRARDNRYAECNLIVKPSTAIQRIMDVFRKKGKVENGKTVALVFEGELLQPNSTVGQADIGDLEIIDAYVR